MLINWTTSFSPTRFGADLKLCNPKHVEGWILSWDDRHLRTFPCSSDAPTSSNSSAFLWCMTHRSSHSRNQVVMDDKVHPKMCELTSKIPNRCLSLTNLQCQLKTVWMEYKAKTETQFWVTRYLLITAHFKVVWSSYPPQLCSMMWRA